MPSDAGYRNWESLPLFDTGGNLPSAYLDGRFYVVSPGFEEESGGIQWSPEDGVILLPTHGPNNILHVPYRGSKAPLRGDKTRFTAPLLADYQEDFEAIEAARAVGRAMVWCPGIWPTEAFQAIEGEEYLLTRPIAHGIVPGITTVTHPLRIKLNGVLDEDAADVAGQTVTANATGELTVMYLAAFRVVVMEYARAVPRGNDFEISLILEEVVQGDFG